MSLDAKRSVSGAALDDLLDEVAPLVTASPRQALAGIRTYLAARPGDPAALDLLGKALQALGEKRWQEKVALLSKGAELHDPKLREAAQLVERGELAAAEAIVRQAVQDNPDDVAALRILAAIGERLERFEDAEALLIRALKLAPHFSAAGFDLANLFYRQNKLEAAIHQLDHLLARHPDNAEYQLLKAAALSRLGKVDEALAIYESVLSALSDEGPIWTLYGHALRTRGRLDDSIAAYRRAIALDPRSGMPWFSLANLKTVRLTEEDVTAMMAALSRDEVGDEDRIHFHFALGKAAEDQGQARESFFHYSEGNRLARRRSPYEPDRITDHVQRSERLFDRAFFAARSHFGSEQSDPIFVLGMPRAGSTLVEQILASHSEIEGTAELPYIPLIAKAIGGGGNALYPECLADLTPQEALGLADEYLAKSRTHRASGRPFFIDKNPPNWVHIGLIRLILPRARIIDVRRHPLACGLSNFKQHFAHGFGFAYSLEHFGLYCRDYVRLLRHFDEVLPGAVHRVIYEQLVEEPEREVRRLLEHLDLPFEEACLRFHENDRIVRTFSSEQVRRPINREGLDQWQAYEPWLGPLKEALGPVFDSYPGVPSS